MPPRVASNPAVGLFAVLGGEAAITFALHCWKLEYRISCGIRDDKPARDNEGRTIGPDGSPYFIGQPAADGSFDWSTFHAVVEIWRVVYEVRSDSASGDPGPRRGRDADVIDGSGLDAGGLVDLVVASWVNRSTAGGPKWWRTRAW